MSTSDLRKQISGRFNGPVREACLRLFDNLSRKSPDQIERLTFPILAAWVERPPEDAVLHAAVAALSQMEDHPLELYFVFLDESEGREVEIDTATMKSAMIERFFVNPVTGEEVAEFQDLVIPVFRATSKFRKSLGE